MASKKPQNTGEKSETTGGSKSPSKKKMTPEEQSAQFIKTARELECDESSDAFEKVVSKIINNV